MTDEIEPYKNSFKIGDGKTFISDGTEAGDPVYNPFAGFEKSLMALSEAAIEMNEIIFRTFGIPPGYFLDDNPIKPDLKAEARKRSREDLDRKRKELRKQR